MSSAADKVAAFAAKHRLPGVVLGIVEPTGLSEVVEHGARDLDHADPVSRSTLFRIASITKTFTATAVVQLRDEGSLGLDDPVVVHLPEFAAVGGIEGAAARVTVRQILQHASGLQGEPPPVDPLSQPLHTSAQILQSLGRARILTTPGTAFRYSNLGFRVLAELIRRCSGTRWMEYAPDRILGPLGMSSSGAHPVRPDGCAVGHAPGRLEDRPTPSPPVDSQFAEGDGDLWSNLDDLSRWVVAQLDAVRGVDSPVLAAASMREMQSSTFVAEDPGEARGLGWNGLARDHGRIVSHGGLFAGFNSQVCFSPRHLVGVVALTNGVPGTSIGELAFDVLDEVIGQRPRPAAETTTLMGVPDDWKTLLGTYHDPDDGEAISIEFRGGRLVCVHSATEPPFPLEPTHDPHVFIGDLEEWRFVTDADRRVIALNAHGYPLVKDDA